MWEAIRRNQRKSIFLIISMAILLVLLGFCIGMVIDPRIGGPLGCLAALAVWFILYLTAIAGGGQLILSTVNAHKIEKKQFPMLWNVVEEMTIASGLEKIPEIYVIEDDIPNAFAVGRNPQKSYVAVTSGLLKRLNRDELQGVIAHEIGHIKNLDVKFMTLASVMMGSIVLLSDIFLRGLFRTGGRSRPSGNDQAQIIFLVIALVLAIVSPLMAQLLYFSCSRKREYLADASSACYTRYPEGLASALEKISPKDTKNGMKVSKALAPLYIVNPLTSDVSHSFFSTHPSSQHRISILRKMAGAGFVSYEQAYRQVYGASKNCLGASTLQSTMDVEKRSPSPLPEEKKETIARVQQVNELLTTIGGYCTICCKCGLMIKIPKDYKHNTIICPKCGTDHEIHPVDAAPVQEEEPLCYERQGSGWETAPCSCGHAINLSPACCVPYVTCPKCNRKINVIVSKKEIN